jgi:hypothetical protein
MGIFMYYVIPRNTKVEIVNVGYDGLYISQDDKFFIYVKTYFSESEYYDEYENDYGTKFVRFIVGRNVNGADREDYETDDEYNDDIVNELMVVCKSSIIMETDLSTQTPVSLGNVSVTV